MRLRRRQADDQGGEVSVIYRIVCDNCGAKSRPSLNHFIELQIDLSREGWKHAPSANPAVMATDYCPGCQGIDGGAE